MKVTRKARLYCLNSTTWILPSDFDGNCFPKRMLRINAVLGIITQAVFQTLFGSYPAGRFLRTVEARPWLITRCNQSQRCCHGDQTENSPATMHLAASFTMACHKRELRGLGDLVFVGVGGIRLGPEGPLAAAGSSSAAAATV